MKIAQSAIQLYSERSFIEKHVKSESLTVWQAGDSERSNQTANSGQGQELDVQKGLVVMSKAVKVSFSEQAMSSRSISRVEQPQAQDKEIMVDLNLRILTSMIERITGKRVRIMSQESPTPATPGEGTQEAQGTVPPETGEQDVQEVSEGGLIYDYFESHYESESTRFAATGKILTEDGQETDFSVALSMSREFYSEERISIRAGEALKDPLVINFSGSAAQLSQTKFSFDIDNDGVANQISFLEQGNGFHDLAAYDSDGNNWIDENDEIYNKLRIWTKDEQGHDSLFALGEKGIGAIYLGAADTLFSMKDTENNLQGEVRATGLFLKEDGWVGTVQQIDLVA